MFKNKKTLLYLSISLSVVVITLYYWQKDRVEELTQPDLIWKDISGENEFRNKQNPDDSNDKSIPYTQVPIQNDPQFITGMNKYLWDKQKATKNICL